MSTEGGGGRSSMHTLVLMRHGESTANLHDRYAGWSDVPLTDAGIAQARSAGRMLREAIAQDLDVAQGDVFDFDGERCDRIVARVLSEVC